MFRAFPWPIVEVARAISGIDHSMNSFKNTLTKVASTVSTLSQSGSKNSSEKASLLGEVDVSEGVSEIVTA